jgi:ribosomal protein S18 acetylase RimI-like enzyme
MTIRPATLEVPDLDSIVHHRRAMFRDMGYRDQDALDSMSVRFRPWLRGKMEAGEYLAWFALAPDSTIAAGLGLWLMDWPPHMAAGGAPHMAVTGTPHIAAGAAWRANILNVYTEPEHRRRGMARALMQIALEWCAANQIGAVIPHASNEGSALYESLGFTPTNEMRLIRPPATD